MRDEPTLAQQAKTRLRRIEGQVRGIQGMLDRMIEEPEARAELERRAQALLAEGRRPGEVAQELSVTRQRVAELTKEREPECGEPCDSLLTQVLAVHAAVEQVGLIIMELHLRQCLLGDVALDEGRTRELRESLRLWSRLS